MVNLSDNIRLLGDGCPSRICMANDFSGLINIPTCLKANCKDSTNIVALFLLRAINL